VIAGAADPAFLGVERSLTGRRWLGPGGEVQRMGQAMAQQTGLPLALCLILAQRGVAPDEAQQFLEPQLRDLLPDPRSLKDMETAAARFLQAVTRGEKIAIFADYDVMGAARRRC